jgi:hypothetical protein
MTNTLVPIPAGNGGGTPSHRDEIYLFTSFNDGIMVEVTGNYYGYVSSEEDTITNLTSDDIECVWFRDEFWHLIDTTSLEKVTYDVHKLTKQNGEEYEFNEFGELSKSGGTQRKNDTEIYDG